MKALHTFFQPSKSYIFVSLAFLLIAASRAFLKQATCHDLPFWINFLFSALCLGCQSLIIAGIRKSLFYTQNLLLNVLRGSFSAIGILCFLLAIQFIPFTNAALLDCTAPIYIPLFASRMLGEKITWKTWTAVFIGFLGVICVIKPTFLAWHQFGNLFGVIAGICFALVSIYTRKLAVRDNPATIAFYTFLVSSVINLPIIWFAGKMPSLVSVSYALYAALFFVGSQFFLFLAYKYAEASKLGIFQYLYVLFAGLIEWFYWGYIPGILDVAGFILIVMSCGLIAKKGRKV